MKDPIIQPLDPESTKKAEQAATKEGYIHRSLVGLDQFMNVLTGGHPDETISSRSARAAEKGKKWGKAMSGFLNLFQRNHGPKAQAGDTARAKEVEKLEKESGGINDRS